GLVVPGALVVQQGPLPVTNPPQRHAHDFVPAIRQAAGALITERVKSTQAQDVIDAFGKFPVGAPPWKQRFDATPSRNAFQAQMSGNRHIVEYRQLAEELRILERFYDTCRGYFMRLAAVQLIAFP